jgi:hypothetical protein
MEKESQVENINSGVWKYIGAHYVPYIIVYLCVFSLIFLFYRNVVFVLVIMAMVGIYGYSFAFNKVKSQFTQEFGKSIGFAYEKATGFDTVSGKLFKTGHSQYLYDVLSGTYQNMPMRIFSFRFTIGSGKNSHTYSYTVFEATLAGTVPDILLFSNAHQNAVTDWFSGNETIELEGDFNKYFKLRVPKGYEQEAYQIFAPDVMVSLIDKARDFSFEFIGNKLYIYSAKVVTTKEEFQSMFTLSEYLTALFQKETASINVDQSAS